MSTILTGHRGQVVKGGGFKTVPIDRIWIEMNETLVFS